MTKCPVCLMSFGDGDYAALGSHLCDYAHQSESNHVRWLNQNISPLRMEPPKLANALRHFFALDSKTLPEWIKFRFIAKFYGEVPHPFVVALQHPTRAVLLGYTVEHQHFLRQWVRSCSYIAARADETDVILYELDNLNTEFGGSGPRSLSHYELLLRMGESLGLPRSGILATPPLPSTAAAIAEWNRWATSEPWVEVLAAMHSLELIANRNLVSEGASIPYFDPAILQGSEIPDAAKAFLREGYEADISHSTQGLALVAKYAKGRASQEAVQSTFLRSIDLFDDYLLARLERAAHFDS